MKHHIRAKRVSNYELFFDLALVLAIGQLTSAIHLDHVGWLELLTFAFSNITIIVLWINEVFYYEKYGDSRRIDIFTVIALMFIIGNLALNFNMDPSDLQAGNSSVVIFNILLFLAYGIIALQYFLKGRKFGFNIDMKVSMGLLIIYMLSILPFALGLLGLHAWTAWVYILPVVLPRLANHEFYHGFKSKTNLPHAIERSQLVTILTFGEAVIAIISTYPLMDNLYQGALLFFGMAVMFMFYMTQTFLAIEHHSRANVTPLFYWHIPIFMGINFFTVGLEFLADQHHAQMGQYMFIAGVLLFYLGTLLTTSYNHRIYHLKPKQYLIFAAWLLAFLIASLLAGPHILPLSIILIVLAWFVNRYYMQTRKLAREYHNVPHPDPTANHRDFS